ncbi:hypothetical protein TcYC6_0055820 [Trypanosoma cruzi]|nr:hypothetical protein TcYC6_0055820 [Trypanosoma cruzi]
MTFRFFFPLAKRVFHPKGRSDGRLRTADFEAFVRRPFRERVMAHAYGPPRKKHDALDRGKVRQESLKQYRAFNAAHAPLQALRREVRREFPLKGKAAFLPRR